MSDSVYTYIKSSVDDFLLDPQDSDFQRGYLAALLGVAEEALGLHLGKSPFMEAAEAVFNPRHDQLAAAGNQSSQARRRKPKAGVVIMGRARKRVSDGTEKKLRNLRPFKPGQSGNPKGRPKGARNRLGTQFLEALEADFNQFGPEAIALVREKKPEVYIRVVADLLPKEANINIEAGEAFVELWRRISDGLGDDLADRVDAEQGPPPSLCH